MVSNSNYVPNPELAAEQLKSEYEQVLEEAGDPESVVQQYLAYAKRARHSGMDEKTISGHVAEMKMTRLLLANPDFVTQARDKLYKDPDRRGLFSEIQKHIQSERSGAPVFGIPRLAQEHFKSLVNELLGSGRYD